MAIGPGAQATCIRVRAIATQHERCTECLETGHRVHRIVSQGSGTASWLYALVATDMLHVCATQSQGRPGKRRWHIAPSAGHGSVCVAGLGVMRRESGCSPVQQPLSSSKGLCPVGRCDQQGVPTLYPRAAPVCAVGVAVWLLGQQEALGQEAGRAGCCGCTSLPWACMAGPCAECLGSACCKHQQLCARPVRVWCDALPAAWLAPQVFQMRRVMKECSMYADNPACTVMCVCHAWCIHCAGQHNQQPLLHVLQLGWCQQQQHCAGPALCEPPCTRQVPR